MSGYKEILEKFRKEQRFRTIPEDNDDEVVIDLLSNDYLGLGAESASIKEEFLQRFPDADFTSSASRLLSRKNKYHHQLEELLGNLYGKKALLLNSGYHANVGLIQALAIPGTLILSDRLIHASAIDGIRLSGADYKRFHHNDMKNLKRVVKESYDLYDRFIVVVESIYSMDGDVAPLKSLVALKREFPKVMIYLDEAHGFGVRGEKGLGLAEEKGFIKDIDIIIGTLGKAAASAGAFVIAEPDMIDYFVNTCRSFIFSTAISPAQAAWSIMMVEKIVGMKDRREKLREISKELISQLERRLNIETVSQSQIVPIIIGDAGEALNMAAHLRSKGFDALAIRKPTVAVGSERIRLSLNAALTVKDITRLVSAIKTYK